MYSKEEAAKLRQEFWISFGKSFPYKWTLYKTGVKNLSFRFYFDTKKAMVCIDIEGSEEERRECFEKMCSLKGILIEIFPENTYQEHYFLENGKEISRIWVEKSQVSIHNKETWQQTMIFLHKRMLQIETFWEEYQDFFKEDF
ncbi:hypothetical protein CAPGI0001_1849 [Capnocytophaga gingivalis ATCC 33624]|jgi:hypothetical protein|nr:DUF4268 domain-containing protein [Capnocytophaga gingivalis]EEK15706.1 hypothetical protein CAPGI0001_1849 [Capnocytophaga gingivalis ATCC 33624]